MSATKNVNTQIWATQYRYQ